MFFSASNLTGGYGGVNIIEECSFNVNRGEIVSILGPIGPRIDTISPLLTLNEHSSIIFTPP